MNVGVDDGVGKHVPPRASGRAPALRRRAAARPAPRRRSQWALRRLGPRASTRRAASSGPPSRNAGGGARRTPHYTQPGAALFRPRNRCTGGAVFAERFPLRAGGRRVSIWARSRAAAREDRRKPAWPRRSIPESGRKDTPSRFRRAGSIPLRRPRARAERSSARCRHQR